MSYYQRSCRNYNLFLQTKYIRIAFLCCVLGMRTYAQSVSISSNAAVPDASSMLDISSTTKGLLIPRMTEAQRTSITNPALGLMVYQTDAGTYGIGYYINGASGSHNWTRVVTSTSGKAWDLLGNTGSTAGTHFIGTTDAVDFVLKTSGTERLRVSSSGSVGIGSAAPESLLEVQGAEATDAIITLDADDGDDNADTWFLKSQASDNDLTILNHTSELVRVTDAGSVGVGTSTPQNKLDVEGGAVIGTNYSGARSAPTDGLLVEGTMGLGTISPQNKLDVEGSVAIGATYSGTSAAPTNGLIVEGAMSVGKTANTAKVDINGDLAMTISSVVLAAAPAAMNDYSLATYSAFIFSGPTSDYIFTGFSGGVDGKVVVLLNNTAKKLKLRHEDAGSSAANRLWLYLWTDIDIEKGGACTLIYSASASRWFVIGNGKP